MYPVRPCPIFRCSYSQSQWRRCISAYFCNQIDVCSFLPWSSALENIARHSKCCFCLHNLLMCRSYHSIRIRHFLWNILLVSLRKVWIAWSGLSPSHMPCNLPLKPPSRAHRGLTLQIYRPLWGIFSFCFRHRYSNGKLHSCWECKNRNHR